MESRWISCRTGAVVWLCFVFVKSRFEKERARLLLRNMRGIISRFGRVWRDAVQGAPERRVAGHTSEGQRGNAPARRGTSREIIPRTFLSPCHPREGGDPMSAPHQQH